MKRLTFLFCELPLSPERSKQWNYEKKLEFSVFLSTVILQSFVHLSSFNKLKKTDHTLLISDNRSLFA